jgi:hypothetical protein
MFFGFALILGVSNIKMKEVVFFEDYDIWNSESISW